jgi:hypothetical protein
MRKAVPAAALAVAAIALSHCAGPEAALTDLAPTAAELDGWAPTGEARVFEGEDLFELINGGAEIYHEFGFRRVLAQDYTDTDGRAISLELYEMDDTAAACGMYSLKSSGRGEELELGDEACLEDYYLNLRKASFVVTLTAMSPDTDTSQGLVQIGRAVASKIQGEGELPEIVAALAAGDPMPRRTHYLRGELALANLVPITLGVRFEMAEGAAARFDDHTAVILRYPDADRARQQLSVVISELGTRSGLEPIEGVVDDSVVLADGRGTRMQLATADNAIVMVVTDEGEDTDQALEGLISRMTEPRAAADAL